jgi:hypothetical protein
VSEDRSPWLADLLPDRLTGREPALSRSNLKRLGRIQLAFLRWLSEQEGDVEILRCWSWIHYDLHGRPEPPPWRKTSKKAERQRAYARWSTAELGRLIRSLLKRELIDVILYEGEEYSRVRFTGDGARR